MGDDPNLDYADPATRSAGTRRPLGAWMMLLAVWGVGLIIWVLYLIALCYLIFKLL